MAKQRIDHNQVVTQAVELIDAEGSQDLALSRVADGLGVQASALYNHVDGLDGLRDAVAVRAAENLAQTLRDAAIGRSGDHAIAAVATAYRAFAVSHPGQYASTALRSFTDDADVESQTTIIEVLARILETYAISGDAAIHMARVVRSAIHGFVTLEATHAFTNAIDQNESFDELVAFLIRGLNSNDEGRS